MYNYTYILKSYFTHKLMKTICKVAMARLIYDHITTNNE
jgi:hypothetical protein